MFICMRSYGILLVLQSLSSLVLKELALKVQSKICSSRNSNFFHTRFKKKKKSDGDIGSVSPSISLSRYLLLNHWADLNQTCYMMRATKFFTSLLSGESVGICSGLHSTAQSSWVLFLLSEKLSLDISCESSA